MTNIPRPTAGIRAESFRTEQDILQDAIRRSSTLLQKVRLVGAVLTEQDMEDINILWSKGVWHHGLVGQGVDRDTLQRALERIEESIAGAQRIEAERSHNSEYGLNRIKAYAVHLEGIRDSLLEEVSKLREDRDQWKERAVVAESVLAMTRSKENPTCKPPLPRSESSTTGVESTT